MKKQLIALMLVFLVVTIPLSYAQITGTTDPELQNLPQAVEPAEDILINVREYQPPVVSSQAFETDDYTGYTVYALLYGLQTNPLIDISKIRSVSVRVQKTTVPGVQVAHRAPPYKYSIDNLGYLLIRLPRIKDERKIPNRIDIDLTANILYDISTGFGVYDIGKNIPQLSEQEFFQNKDKYSFWNGRGYIKADLIEDNRAVFSVYDGRGQRVASGLSLVPGQESREIFLSSGYFFPGVGEEALRRNLREQFKLKLDSIDVPKDKVSLQVLVNNKFISQELTKNQRLYDGSSWKIRDVRQLADQDIVELYNEETQETAIITGSRFQGIDCNAYSSSKALCETINECRYDTTLNKCVSASQQTTTTPIKSITITLNTEAEKELIDAIKFYDTLTPTSTFEEYKRAVNLFADVMRKYSNTVYRATARSYIYKKIYDEKLKNADINLKKEVQDYVGTILKTEGIDAQVQETQVGLKSKDYYLEAIQSYKLAVQQGKLEGSDKYIEAQKKLAELYDYYLNDYSNAIQVYNELINDRDISDIEKSIYQARVEFLQNIGNYFSTPVDLYEDGNLVRVILHGVEKTQVRPQAYISINDQVAKAYSEGDVIEGTTYKIEDIQSNKVTVVSTLSEAISLITAADIALAQQDYRTNPSYLSSFTDSDIKISKFYNAKITETGAKHIPKSISPSSIHSEWGVDVGLVSNADVKPLFNGKVVDKTACSITTDINGFPNYRIKYIHIVPGLNVGDTVDPLYPIGKVASQTDHPDCLKDSTGPHLHLGFLKVGEQKPISLAEFESETRLFSKMYTQVQTSTITGQLFRNELILDRNVILDNINVKLVRIDTKREAHITISPVVKALTSVSNFKVHIPVERRLIRLSDKQIDNHVEAMSKLIDSLNKVIDRVEKIYQYFLAYCISVITVLIIKKLIQGGARDFARHETVKQWEEYCKSKFSGSEVQDCIFKNEKEIDEDTSKVESGVKRTDEITEKIKEIKKNKGTCNAINEAFLNQINEKYDDVPKISLDNLGLLREYCNEAVYEDGELKREDQIRAALLAREKATIDWELKKKKDEGFNRRIEAMQKEFIDSDVNLRISSKIDAEKEKIKRKGGIFYDGNGNPRSYSGLLEKGGVKLEMELKAMGILNEADWEKIKEDKRVQATVEAYLNNKESEINQRASNEILKTEYYKKAIGDIPQKLLDDKGRQLISLKPIEEIFPVDNLNDINQPVNQYNIKIVKKDKEGDPSYYDWYYNNDPIFVVTIKEVAGKKEIERQIPLKKYLDENPTIKNGFADGNFAKLKEELPRNARLSIFKKTSDDKFTFTTINIVREGVPLPKPEYEIGLEDGKLKTITVDYNHYLEVERNSQGLITKLRLYSTEGYLDEFSSSQCAEGLIKNGFKDSIRVCDDLRSADQSLLRDPKKAQAKDIVVQGLTYKLKGAILKTGVLECVHVMGVQDCKWLFSACDPVLCPPSRFQFNGRRVDNVVASGISGSIILGWDLWTFGPPPEIGICIPGILAGLKNIRSIAQSYQQCLLVKKEKGENVGICDTIYNIGICKVLWREAYSLLSIQGGLIGGLFKLFGTDVSGGGEYLFFYQNLKNTGEFVDFLVNEYATTFAQAFRGGSTKELGDTICEYAIYGKLPGGGTFLEQLTRPEGPPQFIATVDEVPHANIGLTPTSDYSVFYHIYAGESYPEVRYSIYLHDIDEQISPSVLYVAPRSGLSAVSTGYLKRGDFVSDTVRISDRPSGYDEVCVVINNVIKKCGFGKVSSDFGVQYLQEQVVKDQLANKNITSARECVPDSTLASQFASASPLQISAAIGSKFLGSGLTQTGIVRKCSIRNPGLGTSPNEELRWEPVGTCGKDSEGRNLGTCWLDTKSYNLLSEEARGKISKSLEEVNKLKGILDELEAKKEILLKNDFRIVLEIIKTGKLLGIPHDANQELGITKDKAKRLVNEYNSKIISKTLEPSLLQQAHFSIGEIKENVGHLLIAKETKEKQELAEKNSPPSTPSPPSTTTNLCVIEYEENDNIKSPSGQEINNNLYFAFINNRWNVQSGAEFYLKLNWNVANEENCNKLTTVTSETQIEICKNLMGKDLQSGTNYIQWIANGKETNQIPYNDDYLIIHSINDKIVNIEHGKASIENINAACSGRETRTAQPQAQLQQPKSFVSKLEIEFVVSDYKNNIFSVFIPNYVYKWTGKEWLLARGILYQRIVSDDYEKGFSIINTYIKENQNSIYNIILDCKNKNYIYNLANEIKPTSVSGWLKNENVMNFLKTKADDCLGVKSALTSDQLNRLSSYDSYINEAINLANNKYGVGITSALVKAVILQESGPVKGWEAAVSPKGAAGLMQLLPETAIEITKDLPNDLKITRNNLFNNVECVIRSDLCPGAPPNYASQLTTFAKNNNYDTIRNLDYRFDARKNIIAGTLYLAKQLKDFNGDKKLALAAYNWGPPKVRTNCPSGYNSCSFDSNTETPVYVDKVLDYESKLE